MRKEAGKITNKELQTSITQIFYYLCVVTIQLVGPVTLIAGTLMMARSFTSKYVALHVVFTIKACIKAVCNYYCDKFLQPSIIDRQ